MDDHEPARVLTQLALRALEESAERARQSAGRSWAARFALAYLGMGKNERWPFDEFWTGLADSDDIRRNATVSAALNGIYRSCGEVRG